MSARFTRQRRCNRALYLVLVVGTGEIAPDGQARIGKMKRSYLPEVFNDWLQRRRLERIIQETYSHYEGQFDLSDEGQLRAFLQCVDQENWESEKQLSFLREKSLRRKAERLAVDIEPAWLEEQSGPWGYTVVRLSERGKVKLGLAIRQARRESWEWWLKVLTPIIMALTALVGTLIGVLAFLKE